MKKRKKLARSYLVGAWSRRETIRKRVASTWTLDGSRALKEATDVYNSRRADLAACMARYELTEDAARVFPDLSGSDLKAPRARPSNIQTKQSEDKTNGSKNESSEATAKTENATPKGKNQTLSENSVPNVRSKSEIATSMPRHWTHAISKPTLTPTSSAHRLQAEQISRT